MVLLRKGSGAKNADGASSGGTGQSAWDFALTGTGELWTVYLGVLVTVLSS